MEQHSGAGACFLVTLSKEGWIEIWLESSSSVLLVALDVYKRQVQFFESLYANRYSQCRKLHNLIDSVIIFDEAQMLPVSYLRPCVSAIGRLVRDYGCSAVLCTATQPALDPLFHEMFSSLSIHELCPEPEAMYQFFRRVRYEGLGQISDEDLAHRLSDERQVLCIVNNRKQAQELYASLSGDNRFHLSTMMFPAHRHTVLEEIRRRLDSKVNEPCRVVSTSLMEAGVDVNFPVVYRAMAGLDSIIQSGGRCNRERKKPLEDSVVYYFATGHKAPDTMTQNIAATEHVILQFQDLDSPEAVKEYFYFLLYKLKNHQALDRQRILEDINSGSFPFASIAKRFKLIDNAACTIYIPLGKGEEFVRQLREIGPNKGLLRKLGPYSVGVYPAHFKALLDSGATEPVMENAAILCDMDLYDMNTGLAFSSEEQMGRAIFF